MNLDLYGRINKVDAEILNVVIVELVNKDSGIKIYSILSISNGPG